MCAPENDQSPHPTVISASVLGLGSSLIATGTAVAAFQYIDNQTAGAWWASALGFICCVFGIWAGFKPKKPCRVVFFCLFGVISILVLMAGIAWDGNQRFELSFYSGCYSMTNRNVSISFINSTITSLTTNCCIDKKTNYGWDYNNGVCFTDILLYQTGDCLCCLSHQKYDTSSLPSGHWFRGVDNCLEIKGEYTNLVLATITFNFFTFSSLLISVCAFCCCNQKKMDIRLAKQLHQDHRRNTQESVILNPVGVGGLNQNIPIANLNTGENIPIANSTQNIPLMVQQNSNNNIPFKPQNSFNNIPFVPQNSMNNIPFVPQNSMNNASFVPQNSMNNIPFMPQNSNNNFQKTAEIVNFNNQ